MNFKSLPLSEKILVGIEALGFEKPTLIQEKVIPLVLKGQDVCGIAQTGSGKTGSYTIPILDKLDVTRRRHKMPRCLILVPTRELAQQVSETFINLGKEFKGLNHVVIIGGASPLKQERALKEGVDVVIATPGRLLDHYERGNIMFHDISTVVIDEADRMLDMGFIPDIEELMSYLRRDKVQILCFSATMPKAIQILVDRFLKNPAQVKFDTGIKPAATIEQVLIKNAGFDRIKRAALRQLLKHEKIKQAIIFCNRKTEVATLARSLKRYQYNADALHGDMTQGQRTATLENFKAGKIDLLIASDVAARGIDIDQLPYVINYDVPVGADEYVHRIGRTGRAGKSGRAFTMVDDENSVLFKRIKQFLPPQVKWMDAQVDLVTDPYAEMGYLKPNLDVSNFVFPSKTVKGFGMAVPRFMTLGA
jgi:Superfamily II DNA and RNA helicases